MKYALFKKPKKENKMEHTRAFIRELLKLVNMNVGPLKPDIQELYYKADEEIKEVEGKLSKKGVK